MWWFSSCFPHLDPLCRHYFAVIVAVIVNLHRSSLQYSKHTIIVSGVVSVISLVTESGTCLGFMLRDNSMQVHKAMTLANYFRDCTVPISLELLYLSQSRLTLIHSRSTIRPHRTLNSAQYAILICDPSYLTNMFISLIYSFQLALYIWNVHLFDPFFPSQVRSISQ